MEHARELGRTHDMSESLQAEHLIEIRGLDPLWHSGLVLSIHSGVACSDQCHVTREFGSFWCCASRARSNNFRNWLWIDGYTRGIESRNQQCGWQNGAVSQSWNFSRHNAFDARCCATRAKQETITTAQRPRLVQLLARR